MKEPERLKELKLIDGDISEMAIHWISVVESQPNEALKQLNDIISFSVEEKTREKIVFYFLKALKDNFSEKFTINYERIAEQCNMLIINAIDSGYYLAARHLIDLKLKYNFGKTAKDSKGEDTNLEVGYTRALKEQLKVAIFINDVEKVKKLNRCFPRIKIDYIGYLDLVNRSLACNANNAKNLRNILIRAPREERFVRLILDVFKGHEYINKISLDKQDHIISGLSDYLPTDLFKEYLLYWLEKTKVFSIKSIASELSQFHQSSILRKIFFTFYNTESNKEEAINFFIELNKKDEGFVGNLINHALNAVSEPVDLLGILIAKWEPPIKSNKSFENIIVGLFGAAAASSGYYRTQLAIFHRQRVFSISPQRIEIAYQLLINFPDLLLDYATKNFYKFDNRIVKDILNLVISKIDENELKTEFQSSDNKETKAMDIINKLKNEYKQIDSNFNKINSLDAKTYLVPIERVSSFAKQIKEKMLNLGLNQRYYLSNLEKLKFTEFYFGVLLNLKKMLSELIGYEIIINPLKPLELGKWQLGVEESGGKISYVVSNSIAVCTDIDAPADLSEAGLSLHIDNILNCAFKNKHIKTDKRFVKDAETREALKKHLEAVTEEISLVRRSLYSKGGCNIGVLLPDIKPALENQNTSIRKSC